MRTKLREEERIIFLTRKHWFALFRPAFLLGASVFLGALLFSYQGESFGFVRLLRQIAVGLVFAALTYFLYSIFERKFNIWVVTNIRVIDEWGVFSHNAKESPLDKINNVSHRQSIIGLLFGFGDVVIQTAAEQGATVLPFVASPKKLYESIVSAQQQHERERHHYEEDMAETRDCPYCAETIKVRARVCRYCGREVPLTEERIPPPTKGDIDGPPVGSQDGVVQVTQYDPKEYWKKNV